MYWAIWRDKESDTLVFGAATRKEVETFINIESTQMEYAEAEGEFVIASNDDVKKVDYLLKACRTALYGVIPDAEANGGRVDRAAVGEVLAEAIRAVEGPEARLW